MKILMAVYSMTGNTLSVAKRIAKELGADLEIIEDNVNRRGIFGFLRSGYEAATKKTLPISEPKHNPSDYEITIIGTPIWAGRMSSPVRSYLMRFQECFKQVAFFATSLGGGHEKTFSEMAELTGVKPLATVEITSGEIKRGKGAEALKAFLEVIKSQKH